MMSQESRILENVHAFNEDDIEGEAGLVDNAQVGDWMLENIPRFECPDADIERNYYFRWWTYRKHLRRTSDGIVVTEFGRDVPWAGRHNAINAAVGHHLYEGRWLRNAPEYLDEYVRSWLEEGSGILSYSSWFGDALLRYCETAGRMELAIESLGGLVRLYRERERTNLHSSGLFWSSDDRDAMECSISGAGLRPTLNSYMYGDARAIARIASIAGRTELEGEFEGKADNLRALIRERLWDDGAGFFKTIPLRSREEDPETWDFSKIDASHNVREELGFLPWYFDIPDPKDADSARRAWERLSDPRGFAAPFGPTTAERSHARFNYPFDHECLWNGPSWPFATSQTLTAMARALRAYPAGTVDTGEYRRVFCSYAASHRRKTAEGRTICWIDENLDPFSGEWVSRAWLESRGWPSAKGGPERGKDYNHSTFCDLVISGIMGVGVGGDGEVELAPLIPPDWGYARVEGIRLNGREVSIYYDRDGSRYGRGCGLRIERAWRRD
jgi:hypothetical protein